MLNAIKKKLNTEGKISLKIKVHPGAKRTAVKEKMSDGTIKIEIAVAPEKGKANDELIGFLADLFDINKKNVTIVSGNKGRIKIISLRR